MTKKEKMWVWKFTISNVKLALYNSDFLAEHIQFSLTRPSIQNHRVSTQM
jgi:hypothetical protein